MKSIPIVLFGIPWTAAALFWMALTSGFEMPNFNFKDGFDVFPLFGIPFVFIGLEMLSSPLRMIRKAKKRRMFQQPFVPSYLMAALQQQFIHSARSVSQTCNATNGPMVQEISSSSINRPMTATTPPMVFWKSPTSRLSKTWFVTWLKHLRRKADRPAGAPFWFIHNQWRCPACPVISVVRW